MHIRAASHYRIQLFRAFLNNDSIQKWKGPLETMGCQASCNNASWKEKKIRAVNNSRSCLLQLLRATAITSRNSIRGLGRTHIRQRDNTRRSTWRLWSPILVSRPLGSINNLNKLIVSPFFRKDKLHRICTYSILRVIVEIGCWNVAKTKWYTMTMIKSKHSKHISNK